MSANVTLKQVAERAGVAWSTASYALNNGPKPVSPAVRERVLSAAKELGYSANLMARDLAAGRGTLLGVMMPEVRSHLTTHQLSGIEEAAQELGYNIMMSVYRSEIDRALLAQNNLMARRMDGIVCVFETAGSTTGELDEVLKSLVEAGVPFVSTYYNPVAGIATDYMLIDHEQGGYIGTRYLLEQGRRAIAIAAPAKVYSAQQRLAGYQRAHAEFGLALREELIIPIERYVLAEGEKVGRMVAQGQPRADAVFAPNDYMAAGVMRYVQRGGLRVPDDVAVLGFDDGAMLCDALEPPLTSIHSPIEEMGRASVRRLIERLKNPKDWTPQVKKFDCSLTRRQSA